MTIFVFTRNEVVDEGGVPEDGEVGVPPALRWSMTQGWVGSHHYRRDSRPPLQHCHLHLKTKATRTRVIQQALDFLYQTQFHSPRILT